MAKMSLAKFESLVPALKERLTKDLEREQEDNALAPDLGGDPLWQTPKVDSKTVAKLSPAVKDITEHRLDPRWIRKGGYPAIAVAVADIINKIKQHRVVPAAPPAVAPAKEVAFSAL
jgi:hypothetical protein